MREVTVFVLVVTVLSGKTLCSVDPCNTALSIGDTKRTTTEDPGTCGGLCDTQIVEGNWYRLDYSNSGARMPESCVPVWSCGTYIPIWMGGPHPTEDNPGPITVPVCAQLTSNGPCCDWTDQIQVKRCFTGFEYFVYRLKKPPFCDMAYCAGTGPNCGDQSSWNDLINNCSSSKYPPLDANPTLSQPYITETKSVTDRNGNIFTAKKFSMKCTLTYTRLTRDDGARYDVVFVAGTDVVYSTTLKSTDPPEVVISETYLIGRVNQQVVCRANSYWVSKYPLRNPFRTSLPYNFRFEILDVKTNTPLDFQATVQEGDKLRVTVRASFPITTPSCFGNSVTQCDPYYNFNVYSSKNLYLSTCTIQVSDGSVSQISLSPIANTDTSRRIGSFYIVPVNTAQTQTSIFNKFQSSTYQISVTERNWVTCSSFGEPRITNFYGQGFTSSPSGDFVLISVPSRKIEIQTRQFPCFDVSCNCGVVAREGNNILGINACSGSASYIRYLTDTNNPGGYIYRTPNSYGVTIVLPSGTSINAAISGKFIQVTVSMYLNPGETTTGLCFHNPGFSSIYRDCGSGCNAYGVSADRSFFNIGRFPSAGPTCFTDAILVPQCDCSTGACSLPSDVALSNYGHTCNAPLQDKRKRQTSSEPTTPGNPPSSGGDNNRPLNLVWPTPKNNITEQQATDACNNALRTSASYDLCVNQVRLDVSVVVQACVSDIQITDDLNFPLPYVPTLMEIWCRLRIDAQNSTDPTKDTNRQIYDSKVCPGQCSSRGNCANGTCKCDSGFVGSDCSVSNGQPPQIRGLVSTVCDIRNDADGCKYVFVQAGALSTKVSCQINDTSGRLISFDYSPDVYREMVRCRLPVLPVTLDITRDYKQCSFEVRVSISNDQHVYSSNWQNFTVFDGVNTTCTSDGCKPKEGVKCCSERNLATVSLLVLGYIFGKYALRFILQ